MTLPEFRDDETPPRGKIIYQENTDKGMVTDSLLLFRVQNQIERSDGGELVAEETASHERREFVVALEQS